MSAMELSMRASLPLVDNMPLFHPTKKDSPNILEL